MDSQKYKIVVRGSSAAYEAVQWAKNQFDGFENFNIDTGWPEDSITFTFYNSEHATLFALKWGI